MKKQTRPINDRLKRAKSAESKAATIKGWLNKWVREQNQLIADLEQAVSHDDYDATCIALGQLKMVLSKKMTALPNIFEQILKIDNAQSGIDNRD